MFKLPLTRISIDPVVLRKKNDYNSVRVLPRTGAAERNIG